MSLKYYFTRKEQRKREQNLIFGNENTGLKITDENDLLVKNLESQESCDTNVCVVEFGVHITYRCDICFRMPWLAKMVFASIKSQN
jgi:hypothetical protein